MRICSFVSLNKLQNARCNDKDSKLNSLSLFQPKYTVYKRCYQDKVDILVVFCPWYGSQDLIQGHPSVM